MTVHVFVSYAKKDTRELAERICKEIEGVAGLSAWMDVSLEFGDSWATQIEHEIDRCNYFVVLLSPDVNRHKDGVSPRSFVLNEISHALSQGKQIIPVMAQSTTPPLTISELQYIDLTRDVNVGIQKLLSHIAIKAGIDDPGIWIPTEVTFASQTLVVLPIRPIKGQVFCIGKHPVTNAQYREFVESTSAQPPVGQVFERKPSPHWSGPFSPWEDKGFNLPDQPVVCVTYDDAISYCRWLGKNLNLSFNLPPSPLWSFAAFGTPNFTYDPKHWFTSISQPIHKADYPCILDRVGNRNNRLGVSDLIGNIWEWSLLNEPNDSVDHYISAISVASLFSSLAMGQMKREQELKKVENQVSEPIQKPVVPRDKPTMATEASDRYSGYVYGGSYLDDLYRVVPQVDIRLLENKKMTSHADLGFRVCALLPEGRVDNAILKKLNGLPSYPWCEDVMRMIVKH